jgi:hypothetical protein
MNLDRLCTLAQFALLGHESFDELVSSIKDLSGLVIDDR